MPNHRNPIQKPSDKKNSRNSSPHGDERMIQSNQRGSDSNASKDKERKSQGDNMHRGENNSKRKGD